MAAKSKYAEYNRAYYEANKEKIKRAAAKRRNEIRAWWKQFKRTLVCQHCGEDAPECIDLHHINDSKNDRTDSAYKWVRNARSKEWILNEVKTNCIPLCANCHRKEHAKEYS